MKRIIELEKIQNYQQVKLKANQQQKFAKMIHSLPGTNLEEVVLEYKKHQMSHYRNVGVVMLPKSNPRYEKFSSLMRERIFDELRQQDKYFLNLDEECLKRMTF